MATHCNDQLPQTESSYKVKSLCGRYPSAQSKQINISFLNAAVPFLGKFWIQNSKNPMAIHLICSFFLVQDDKRISCRVCGAYYSFLSYIYYTRHSVAGCTGLWNERTASFICTHKIGRHSRIKTPCLQETMFVQNTNWPTTHIKRTYHCFIEIVTNEH